MTFKISAVRIFDYVHSPIPLQISHKISGVINQSISQSINQSACQSVSHRSLFQAQLID